MFLHCAGDVMHREKWRNMREVRPEQQSVPTAEAFSTTRIMTVFLRFAPLVMEIEGSKNTKFSRAA